MEIINQVFCLILVPRKYLPGVVSRMQYGIFLCLAQLFLGSLLVGLAIWKLSIQHHIYSRGDWPLYSGILVLLSGWGGLVLVCCCRYYYPGSKHHTCIFPIKTSSIVSRQNIMNTSSHFHVAAPQSLHLPHLLPPHPGQLHLPPVAPDHFPLLSLLPASSSSRLATSLLSLSQ